MPWSANLTPTSTGLAQAALSITGNPLHVCVYTCVYIWYKFELCQCAYKIWKCELLNKVFAVICTKNYTNKRRVSQRQCITLLELKLNVYSRHNQEQTDDNLPKHCKRFTPSTYYLKAMTISFSQETRYRRSELFLSCKGFMSKIIHGSEVFANLIINWITVYHNHKLCLS